MRGMRHVIFVCLFAFNLPQYVVVIGAMAMAGAERACCSHAPATMR